VDEHLLQATGLRKNFGAREVVRGIDLKVRAGEIVGLLGKNGAGKTTSFRMVIGLLKPTAGTVSFRGRDVSQLPMYERARLGMGYLAQEPSIFTRMTVTDNIAAILELMDMPPSERTARLEQLITEFGLGKVRDSKAATLSGGERRRLEIARALATEPELLLFDEPFSGIDPIAVFEIQEVIYDLRAKGLGILLTDHNVRETLAITDRAYIMEEGEIWLEGEPAELVNHPDARRLYLGERFHLDVSEAKRATRERSEKRLGSSAPDATSGDAPVDREDPSR
jgi:lipopolysaccharide export system ATP-binding protein